MRKRTAFHLFGMVVALGLLIFTDPDLAIFTNMPFGAKAANFVLLFSGAFLGLSLLHFGRKYLIDRIDFQRMLLDACDYKDGKPDPVAAAIAAVAVGLMAIAYAVVIAAALYLMSSNLVV